MAVYDPLMSEFGGGIPDPNKIKNNIRQAHLFIGLGGSGIDALKGIKREVFRTFQPDGFGSEVPEISNLRFLAIDREEGSVTGDGHACLFELDRSREFLSLEDDDRDEYRSLQGTRQLGRLLLINRSQTVFDRIMQDLISLYRSGFASELSVHMIAGLSGTTGGAVFLDICYMIRQILAELGMPWRVKLIGYFFLPKVYLGLSSSNSGIPSASQLNANAYCALQELDYCMNLHQNQGRFVMDYGFRRIDTQAKPLDGCFLVSELDLHYQISSYGNVLNTLARYIVDTMCDDRETPAESPYSFLGAASLEVPVSDIATYLGASLFLQLNAIFDQYPTDAELTEFAEFSGITSKHIWRKMTEGCRTEVLFGDEYDYQMFQENGNHGFVAAAEEFYDYNVGILEKNLCRLRTDLNFCECAGDSTSLIGELYRVLRESYFGEISYGPIYIRNLLVGMHNRNLCTQIDGLLEENKQRLLLERRQSDFFDKEYDAALDRLRNANILNRRGRVSDYKLALNNIYRNRYQITVFEKTEELLHILRQQIRDLDDGLLRPMEQVLQTLRETSERNRCYLAEGNVSRGFVSSPVLKTEEIRQGLDQMAGSRDSAVILRRLMAEFMKDTSRWLDADPRKITQLISEFVQREFYTVLSKNLSDYLQIKFDALYPDEGIKQWHQDAFRFLRMRSVPLITLMPGAAERAKREICLVIPGDQKSLYEAAEYYRLNNNSDCTVRYSQGQNAIRMIQVLSGIPLDACSRIENMRDAYHSLDGIPGLHLFEAIAPK